VWDSDRFGFIPGTVAKIILSYIPGGAEVFGHTWTKFEENIVLGLRFSLMGTIFWIFSLFGTVSPFHKCILYLFSDSRTD
jgi:hypothetical protein